MYSGLVGYGMMYVVGGYLLYLSEEHVRPIFTLKWKQYVLLKC
jgi:hypothetical protein